MIQQRKKVSPAVKRLNTNHPLLSNPAEIANRADTWQREFRRIVAKGDVFYSIGIWSESLALIQREIWGVETRHEGAIKSVPNVTETPPAPVTALGTSFRLPRLFYHVAGVERGGGCEWYNVDETVWNWPWSESCKFSAATSSSWLRRGVTHQPEVGEAVVSASLRDTVLSLRMKGVAVLEVRSFWYLIRGELQSFSVSLVCRSSRGGLVEIMEFANNFGCGRDIRVQC